LARDTLWQHRIERPAAIPRSGALRKEPQLFEVLGDRRIADAEILREDEREVRRLVLPREQAVRR
jgi:hypothetical protein